MYKNRCMVRQGGKWFWGYSKVSPTILKEIIRKERIMRKISWILILLVILTGCAHSIAVVTLESTIQQAAIAAKRAAGDASKKLTIEVSVANGYKGSATIPIPVVPIGAETSLTQTTKLTMDIDLKNFVIPKETKGVSGAPSTLFFLDRNTGMLTEQQ